MDKYRITATTTFPAGARLSLSKSQASARSHLLRRVGPDFETIAPVQFKAGEEIGYEGELPKSLAESVTKRKAKPTNDANSADPAA